MVHRYWYTRVTCHDQGMSQVSTHVRESSGINRQVVVTLVINASKYIAVYVICTITLEIYICLKYILYLLLMVFSFSLYEELLDNL
jgi:hypothetical protein